MVRYTQYYFQTFIRNHKQSVNFYRKYSSLSLLSLPSLSPLSLSLPLSLSPSLPLSLSPSLSLSVSLSRHVAEVMHKREKERINSYVHIQCAYTATCIYSYVHIQCECPFILPSIFPYQATRQYSTCAVNHTYITCSKRNFNQICTAVLLS